ncbi:MAG: helix-turn-helix domain-containing protein [Pyrinomonadaceae bacterium]
MARRKFRNNQRHESFTERSFQEYVLSAPAQQTSRDELMRLVRGGEDTFLELKVKLSNTEKIAQEIVALANTGGGVMVFGVNDQLRVEGLEDSDDVQDEIVRICRDEIVPSLVPFIDRIAFDNGRRIVALDIDGKRRPYRTRDGRFYIRTGAEKREATREELSALLDEARPLKYENVPVPGATLADIDEAHLWSFARAFEGDALEERSAVNYPTGELLERDLLLAISGEAGGAVIPTIAGVLLFGRDERVAELLPRSCVVATRFAGDTAQSPVIERVQLSGNLFTLYESALRFLTRYCDLWEGRPRSFPGHDVDNGESAAGITARANYSSLAVKESLANALVHRDLALRDQLTRLHVFDHSLEFVNPRRTNGFAPAALRAIRYGVPQSLNPQLKAIFSSAAYGLPDVAHNGLPLLLREARLFSGKRAELRCFNDEFRLRLHGL